MSELATGPGSDRPRLRADAVLTFHAIDEPVPGHAWRERFEALWPAYQAWFLRDGDAARPDYRLARWMLTRNMPEIVPAWEHMVDLAGGGDLAARMLALFDPPPLVAGCSQLAIGGERPLLVRNYDFDPGKLEGVVLATALTGRRVMGTSDCLWGLLDGVNQPGLAVSLAFGGSRRLGTGFGISIVLRYLLETCATTAEAVAVLARLPIQAAYNLTLVDAEGEAVTVFVGPDRAPAVRRPAIATNHQETPEWAEHEAATRSLERAARLDDLIAAREDEARLAGAFLEPPLYTTLYARGFGTLYTAVHRPAERTVEYRWPGQTWQLALDAFEEGSRTVSLGG